TAAGLSQTISDAAKALKRPLLDLAAGTSLEGLGPHEVEFADGRLRKKGDPDRSAGLDLLVSRCPSGTVEAINAVPPEMEEGEEDYEANKEKVAFHSFGAHFIEVAIDELVPLVRVTRVVSVMD